MTAKIKQLNTEITCPRVWKWCLSYYSALDSERLSLCDVLFSVLFTTDDISIFGLCGISIVFERMGEIFPCPEVIEGSFLRSFFGFFLGSVNLTERVISITPERNNNAVLQKDGSPKNEEETIKINIPRKNVDLRSIIHNIIHPLFKLTKKGHVPMCPSNKDN